MNEDDSQKIAGIYTACGWQLTEDRKDADLVIINSCTVRQHAEDRAVSELGRLREWKKARSGRKIIFAGCAAERLGKILKKRFPFMDDFVGARNQDKFKKLAGEEIEGYTNSKLFNSPVTDYLTIMRGCSMKCTYCIVPSVRGPAVSIPALSILEEAKRKTEEGIKELILLGQTVNCWKDPSSGENFSALLKKLCLIKGLKRIKFMSPHPIFFDEDFFKTFAENTKLARHIHLPAQSGSDRILKLMKRGYDAGSYLKILEKLRKAAPEVSISADFIVGFPGETEEDFQKTLELARKARFSFAFCFKYSPRTDRPEDISDVSEKEAGKRLNRLLEIIKRGSKEIFQERIGKTEEVLLEKEGFGKTSTGFNCAIIDSKKTGPGSAVKVKIERAVRNILYGKVLK